VKTQVFFVLWLHLKKNSSYPGPFSQQWQEPGQVFHTITQVFYQITRVFCTLTQVFFHKNPGEILKLAGEMWFIMAGYQNY